MIKTKKISRVSNKIKKAKPSVKRPLNTPKKSLAKTSASKTVIKTKVNNNIKQKTVKTALTVVKTPNMIKKEEQAKENEKRLKDNARSLLSDGNLKNYLAKNVGSNANSILDILIEGPNVDEKIAEFLKLKLNETRRMLNLLNNFGMVKYNINKDNNGWLTFVWYVDFGSVDTFSKKIKELSETKISYLPENCNDFFICKDCSKTHALVVPFETAFEAEFKCICGKGMIMIDKVKAEELYKSTSKI